jgi:molybdopterin molybdotransferase
MSEFLELLPPREALQKLLLHLPDRIQAAEQVYTADALGRVIQDAVTSTEPLPAFPRSTVDGFAVHAADTYGASETLPAYLNLIGEIPMGKPPSFSLPRGSAASIHTGGMLPEGADGVLMLEHSQGSRPGELEVLRAVGVWENVLKVGEDVSAGQEIIPAGTRIRAAEIGGLAALGITRVKVVKQPVVGILSSGDEVVPPDQAVQPGQVRDINSYSLSGLVTATGAVPRLYGIVSDQAEKLEEKLQIALQDCDLVVVTAGSSASTRDLTAAVINKIGQPGVLVHGVNVRPGKPTILAVCRRKAVIGLPGNPVSALVIARLFVLPVIEKLLGLNKPISPSGINARLAVNLASQAGREDYIPVRLLPADDGVLADPIFFKSNLIFTLVRADGLLRIPADATGLAAGSQVWVEYL